jgi:predicted dehydrogenase
MTIKVGVIGTSWWADSMYLPALKSHTQMKVTAVRGRSRENRWVEWKEIVGS